jgi:hypothetical protein
VARRGAESEKGERDGPGRSWRLCSMERVCASRPLRYVSVINDNHLVSLMNFNAAKVN